MKCTYVVPKESTSKARTVQLKGDTGFWTKVPVQIKTWRVFSWVRTEATTLIPGSRGTVASLKQRYSLKVRKPDTSTQISTKTTFL